MKTIAPRTYRTEHIIYRVDHGNNSTTNIQNRTLYTELIMTTMVLQLATTLYKPGAYGNKRTIMLYMTYSTDIESELQERS